MATHVSTTLPRDQTADALAVLNDTLISPEDAREALLPGGYLYMEVNRRSASMRGMSPARVRRMLREASLSLVGTYIVLPHFDAIELYLPVDASGALEWYFRSVYRAATPAQRLFEVGARGMGRLGIGHVARLAPYFAITAVVGDTGHAMPSILAHPELPEPLRGERLLPVMLTDAGTRVTMLAFRAGEREPSAVLKTPKLPTYNARTENEHRALKRIRSRLDGSMLASVPRPLGLLAHGDVSVAVESYLPGTALEQTCRRWGVPLERKVGGLDRATDWLIEFHTRAQDARSTWGSTERSAWLDEPLSVYEAIFDLTTDERRLFTLARRHADSLDGRGFPIVWRHRDFNIWNVFQDGPAVRVIDWEGCEPGPALCDLLHFVAHWHDAVRGTRNLADRREAYRLLFFGHDIADRAVAAAHQSIADYMRRLNLDCAYFPLLLLYTWVELALRRHQLQQDRDDLPLDVRAGNQTIAFIEILASHADILFSNATRWQFAPAD